MSKESKNKEIFNTFVKFQKLRVQQADLNTKTTVMSAGEWDSKKARLDTVREVAPKQLLEDKEHRESLFALIDVQELLRDLPES